MQFPMSEEQIKEVKSGFYKIRKIPNVVGASDGTLIPIINPIENEEAYICRKGFHVLNVQAVVNH
ncbi:hypothetical protein DPMN_016735 [Dreissena polymorpha]|uniref:Uncharacterized protein n=2 Tax=Dreissena polymorpha TaxID=45954 RepID=A0A9D4NF59_DREPO|nr:hypothetical protein DPMN_016735 [Dreissena polymorpha]